jgi:hypothetical protein
MGVHRVENWSAFRRTVCGGEVRLKPDATYDEVRLKPDAAYERGFEVRIPLTSLREAVALCDM